MGKHHTFEDPHHFERMLGIMLAALLRWSSDPYRKMTPREHDLATGSGKHEPMNVAEAAELLKYLVRAINSVNPAQSQVSNSEFDSSSAISFTRPPWSITNRGDRALIIGSDNSGKWELASVNMCMGDISKANLALIFNSPRVFDALQSLLIAYYDHLPIPWEAAISVADSVVFNKTVA